VPGGGISSTPVSMATRGEARQTTQTNFSDYDRTQLQALEVGPYLLNIP